MKLEKIVKKLGPDTIKELDGLSKGAMEAMIVVAEQAMKQVYDELEANPKYQELKDSLAALKEGKKAVDSRQRAIIAYCLHKLAES